LGKSSDPVPSTRRNQNPADLAAEAARIAQASDARAPWAVESITLQSLPDFITRDSLPDEFSLDHIDCSKDALLKEIYEWVFANFDRNKPIHMIALLAGIFISHILPDLFWDEQDRPSNAKVSTERSCTAAVRALPWKPNRGTRKGSTWKPQFISMVPAYIIAVYDAQSPLRRYFARKNAFPSQWNAKNSAKGIGSLNLVRLGLAKARSSRVFKGGAPLKDWILLTTDEVAVIHRQLLAHLNDRQYGPFRIAVAFFGLDKAVEMGRATSTYTIHPAMASISINNKRERQPDVSDDDDIEELPAPMSKRSRK